MRYLVATDEAGYGPNLGPLVVTCLVWETPDDWHHEDLYRHLAAAVSADRPQRDDDRLWVADSKRVYQPRGSLQFLESAAWSALLAMHGVLPTNWRDLWQTSLPGGAQAFLHIPWYADDVPALPCKVNCHEIRRQGSQLVATLANHGARWVGLAVRAVTASEFNARLACLPNKATLLTETTLDLVFGELSRLSGNVSILCDKHGGRSRYSQALQPYCDSLVQVRCESRETSHYGWNTERGPVEIHFRSKADSLLLPAWASMVSKYLRELAMQAFNRFWNAASQAELRPTAGYPQDARRFVDEIAQVQAHLGIAASTLWRQR